MNIPKLKNQKIEKKKHENACAIFEFMLLKILLIWKILLFLKISLFLNLTYITKFAPVLKNYEYWVSFYYINVEIYCI